MLLSRKGNMRVIGERIMPLRLAFGERKPREDVGKLVNGAGQVDVHGVGGIVHFHRHERALDGLGLEGAAGVTELALGAGRAHPRRPDGVVEEGHRLDLTTEDGTSTILDGLDLLNAGFDLVDSRDFDDNGDRPRRLGRRLGSRPDGRCRRLFDRLGGSDSELGLRQSSACLAASRVERYPDESETTFRAELLPLRFAHAPAVELLIVGTAEAGRRAEGEVGTRRDAVPVLPRVHRSDDRRLTRDRDRRFQRLGRDGSGLR